MAHEGDTSDQKRSDSGDIGGDLVGGDSPSLDAERQSAPPVTAIPPSSPPPPAASSSLPPTADCPPEITVTAKSLQETQSEGLISGSANSHNDDGDHSGNRHHDLGEIDATQGHHQGATAAATPSPKPISTFSDDNAIGSANVGDDRDAADTEADVVHRAASPGPGRASTWMPPSTSAPDTRANATFAEPDPCADNRIHRDQPDEADALKTTQNVASAVDTRNDVNGDVKITHLGLGASTSPRPFHTNAAGNITRDDFSTSTANVTRSIGIFKAHRSRSLQNLKHTSGLSPLSTPPSPLVHTFSEPSLPPLSPPQPASSQQRERHEQHEQHHESLLNSAMARITAWFQFIRFGRSGVSRSNQQQHQHQHTAMHNARNGKMAQKLAHQRSEQATPLSASLESMQSEAVEKPSVLDPGPVSEWAREAYIRRGGSDRQVKRSGPSMYSISECSDLGASAETVIPGNGGASSHAYTGCGIESPPTSDSGRPSQTHASNHLKSFHVTLSNVASRLNLALTSPGRHGGGAGMHTDQGVSSPTTVYSDRSTPVSTGLPTPSTLSPNMPKRPLSYIDTTTMMSMKPTPKSATAAASLPITAAQEWGFVTQQLQHLCTDLENDDDFSVIAAKWVDHSPEAGSRHGQQQDIEQLEGEEQDGQMQLQQQEEHKVSCGVDVV